MKVLVLGHTGMAGHTIKSYLEEKGYEVYTSHARLPEEIDRIDFKYIDVVINCIGMLVEASEKNKALATYINSYFPHYLSEQKPKVIHLSTDCIFDDNFYGRSKALGELNNDKDLTLRMSIIGTDLKPEGTGLFNWFMQQKEVDGYANAIWNGITTLELAKVIDEAIKQNLTGIYSPLPEEPITKYMLLHLIANVWDKDVVINLKEAGSDKTLTEKRTDFNYKVPNYLKMLIDMKEWTDEELYPHYC